MYIYIYKQYYYQDDNHVNKGMQNPICVVPSTGGIVAILGILLSISCGFVCSGMMWNHWLERLASWVFAMLKISWGTVLWSHDTIILCTFTATCATEIPLNGSFGAVYDSTFTVAWKIIHCFISLFDSILIIALFCCTQRFFNPGHAAHWSPAQGTFSRTVH